MEQQIAFCTSADGTRIAYATWGAGPRLPIVMVPPWSSSFELEWQRPDMRGFFEALGERRLVVKLDRRGIAASQRDVDDLSLDAHVHDLTAVVDHLKLDLFHLLGLYDGGAVAVAYAVRHPERVARLGLLGAAARGERTLAGPTREGLIELIRSNWSMARRMIASAVLPDGPVEAQRWFSRLLKESVSPEMAVRYYQFTDGFDVSALLPEVRVTAGLDVSALLPEVRAPALVVQFQADRSVSVKAGREVASLLPNARLVVVEGTGARLRPNQAERVKEFYDEDLLTQAPTAHPAAGALVTILFTDLAASTALTQRLGDAKAQELVRTHNVIVRGALASNGGSEVKHTGDGIMASFPSASAALACAIEIQRGVAASAPPPVGEGSGEGSALAVHIGLNAGEPVQEDEDLFGTAVQLARRICDHAQAGDVLVSNVVRELAAGKGFLFADRGETELRGFEDPVRLYELRWRD